MGVLLLHGRNSVDIEGRIRSAASADDPAGLNATSLDLSTAEFPDVVSALTTPGFFGSSRTVTMYGLPGIDKSARVEWEQIEPLLKSLSDSTSAILVTFQRIPSNRKVMKTAKASGWEVELHDLLYGRELLQWVAERASVAGATIDQAASRELLDRLYPTTWQREDRWSQQAINMRLISTEVEKLASGSFDGHITSDAVSQLVVDRSGVTAFKLNDETFEGRVNGALTELDNVLADGEAPERVIGQLGYQPLVLYAARFVQRYGPDTVSESSGISSGQLKATIGRKNAWRDHDGLAEAVEVLRRVEWLVKTGRASSADTVLAPAVAEIAAAFEAKRN